MFKDLAEKKVWLVYGEGKAPRDLDGNIIDGSNGSYWTRAEAEAAVAKNEDLRGVGISFKNSGFRGIDLDSCINEEGVVTSWAREVIEQVGGLVDISMSGKGLKVIVRDDTDLGQAYIKSTVWDGEEILGMSDRALVMHEGRLMGELPREALSEESIMRLATGAA